MDESRRKFLKASACGLTGAAMLASMDQLNLVNAMVQDQQPDAASDYKALVCIFLSGGTDCNNMVIPYDEYTNPTGGSTNGYDNVRGYYQSVWMDSMTTGIMESNGTYDDLANFHLSSCRGFDAKYARFFRLNFRRNLVRLECQQDIANCHGVTVILVPGGEQPAGDGFADRGNFNIETHGESKNGDCA